MILLPGAPVLVPIVPLFASFSIDPEMLVVQAFIAHYKMIEESST
jgi:hypothetical protein